MAANAGASMQRNVVLALKDDLVHLSVLPVTDAISS